MKKRASLPLEPLKKSDTALDRIVDALIFAGFLLLSVIALAAVAVATPVVLAISALAGLISRNNEDDGWRPAGA